MKSFSRDLWSPHHAPEVAMIHQAITRTGRNIALSTSPGEMPTSQARHVRTNANMWRIVGDFRDSWEPLKEHSGVCQRWAPFIRRGNWPGAALPPLSRLRIRAGRGDDRMPRSARGGQLTLMSLWSIFRSPLMSGGDLPSNDAFTLALLTNKNVLALHRSTTNRQLLRRNDLIVWTDDDPATGDKFLALFDAQDQELAGPAEAAWASALITRQTPSQSQPLDVTLPERAQRRQHCLEPGHLAEAGAEQQWQAGVAGLTAPTERHGGLRSDYGE